MSKFKSVSVRDNTFDEIKKLSNELLPSVQLSNAQTIDRMTSIVKNSLNQFNTRELNVHKKK
jgi:hypothetical protein|tara:strand:+ start:777 stop:962 length:186 start_codon:yes stop_codon:yes gene_type:complete